MAQLQQKSPRQQQMSDLERLRHSCAHILANAVLEIWPEAQLATGPPIQQGFYYDINLEHRITPDDFALIEEKMQAIIKRNEPFVKQVVSREQALSLAEKGRLAALTDRPHPSRYKIDLLTEIPTDEEISLYQNGDFVDLCAGSHVARTGNCKAFKILSVSAAFYQGDANKDSLQRIYGTCFKNKTLLQEHLTLLEQAKQRDHRKLGRELDLFHIDEMVGQGLILWTPKGTIIRKELEQFILAELAQQGYQNVVTPHIGKLDLYRTSGHFPYYTDSQYPPIPTQGVWSKACDEQTSCSELMTGLLEGKLDGYMLKPMNCPHHIRIFSSKQHSYRDLPVRLSEFGTVYRWEQSGELGGMTRVRGFTQDDAHIFCTEDQVGQEVTNCIELVEKVLAVLGMHDYRVRLSVRDNSSDKYVGDDNLWCNAEQAIQHILENKKISYELGEGEAAFYGPKIDFIVRDVLMREWQLGTIQLDYNLPQRFQLNYTDKEGKKQTPVMIHRAPFGSLERFIGLLIEHFDGKFPLWLSPQQIAIIPVTDKQVSYANTIATECQQHGIRYKVYQQSDKLGAKIRLARNERTPYIVVVGEQEAEKNTVSLRVRGQEKPVMQSLAEFMNMLQQAIAQRSL